MDDTNSIKILNIVQINIDYYYARVYCLHFMLCKPDMAWPFMTTFFDYPFTLQMLSSKDLNFVGYTYKNFEVVNDYAVPGMSMLLSLLYLPSYVHRLTWYWFHNHV